MVDGVISVGQVRKDHPDAGFLILSQRLARPLGGGADLLGAAFQPDPALRVGRGLGGGMVLDMPSRPFNPGEKGGGLRLDALKR